MPISSRVVCFEALGYTDTGRDLEAMRKEMYKFGGGGGGSFEESDYTAFLPDDTSVGGVGGLASRKTSLLATTGSEVNEGGASRKGSFATTGDKTRQSETGNNSALNRVFQPEKSSMYLKFLKIYLLCIF